ncbi:MAG: hypothetical protein IJU14_04905 [Clostridia bacterium]|nr:hypothetical protein [Clostridia bacterium]
MKIIKTLTTAVLVCMMIAFSMINSFAVKINNNEFQSGDIITYIVQIKTDTRLSGLNGMIEYPKDALELDKESLNIPELGDMVISNPDEEGVIRFVATNAGEGFDCSQTKLIVTVSFKVKEKATDSDIKFTVTEVTDVQLNDINLADNEIIKSVQKGKYEGKIINPGNGEDIVDDGAYIDIDSSDESTPDSKNKTIIITLIVAVVLIAVASVSVKLKNKKNEN